MKLTPRIPRRARASQRRGVAAVEFAVCLPVLAMLVFGSLEACTMIFVDQTLSIASYEGIRVAIQKDATSADVIRRCKDILTSRNINGAKVDLQPTNVSGLSPGTDVTVTVSAPCDSNSLIPPWFFGGRTLESQTMMVKE